MLPTCFSLNNNKLLLRPPDNHEKINGALECLVRPPAVTHKFSLSLPPFIHSGPTPTTDVLPSKFTQPPPPQLLQLKVFTYRLGQLSIYIKTAFDPSSNCTHHPLTFRVTRFGATIQETSLCLIQLPQVKHVCIVRGNFCRERMRKFLKKLFRYSEILEVLRYSQCLP